MRRSRGSECRTQNLLDALTNPPTRIIGWKLEPYALRVIIGRT
jgi:hypothetical protein